MAQNQNRPWLERRIQAYPPPKYSKLLKAYSFYEGVSESSVVSSALKLFFNSIPEGEREKILKLYNENPSKNSY